MDEIMDLMKDPWILDQLKKVEILVTKIRDK